ncbi:hypothetical protein D1872_292540 [compost metagenome]
MIRIPSRSLRGEEVVASPLFDNGRSLTVGVLEEPALEGFRVCIVRIHFEDGHGVIGPAILARGRH